MTVGLAIDTATRCWMAAAAGPMLTPAGNNASTGCCCVVAGLAATPAVVHTTVPVRGTTRSPVDLLELAAALDGVGGPATGWLESTELVTTEQTDVSAAARFSSSVLTVRLLT